MHASQILYNALKGYKVKFHLFISWSEWKQVNDALDVSDIKTLKLRNGKGWSKGPRPFDREGLKIRASDVL